MRGFVTSPDGEPLDLSSLDSQRLRVFCRTSGMECIQCTLTDHRSSCRLPLATQVCSRDLSDAEQHSGQPWENMETAGGSCARSADPRLDPGNCVCRQSTVHTVSCPSVASPLLLHPAVPSPLLYSPGYSPTTKSSSATEILQYRISQANLFNFISTTLPVPSNILSNPNPHTSENSPGLQMMYGIYDAPA
ncbi:hypothetical protein ASPSYDRAFT_44795 [Aspergillus sydowii CBS 593.65]|uniref:Uncharacterized protein n=1 Tax=Aspergillus sydowii CBS 593.65 TaxID=1036612 RepID=A0A1L9TG84_9EURO|nr:uncharacterized protein ASPSYDRAFT_44795 [Aspergillus sydowii CBS 593.65]OJJ58447.1 hypothetical protein ASPSYDRAFT_44795 [Aspergillus sydowii CBS 593.65]